MDIKKFKELTQEDLDELFEDREDLKEKLKHLSGKNLLEIAIDFFECKAKVTAEFPCIRGFMFRDGKIIFIVDESINEEKKKKIRKFLVGFADFNKIVAKIKE